MKYINCKLFKLCELPKTTWGKHRKLQNLFAFLQFLQNKIN